MLDWEEKAWGYGSPPPVEGGPVSAEGSRLVFLVLRRSWDWARRPQSQIFSAQEHLLLER